MFVGRDFSELLMYPKTDWTDKELTHYQLSFQQIIPYLNSEGLMIQHEIMNEIIERGGMDEVQLP